MPRANLVLGLGSNLGLPLDNLRATLQRLRASSNFKILKVASIYESEALLPPGAEHDSWNKKFLNSAVLCEFDSEQPPEELLKSLKEIECKVGRTPAERWAPRIIDIDILAWTLADYTSKSLSIPHIELKKRPFALLPLQELWPEYESHIRWNDDCGTVKSSKHFWPKMIGILNITEDSFSDGGNFLKPDLIATQAMKLVRDGAEILDVGAESTRPGAKSVSVAEEQEKLIMALETIKSLDSKVLISLDCRRSEVVETVLNRFQVDFLNDVEGFSTSGMKKKLKETGAFGLVMHSLGIPPTKEQILSEKLSPISQLNAWWEHKQKELIDYGIAQDKLICDPGIGFGKSSIQSMEILKNPHLISKASQIALGYSRKSFMKLFTENEASNRDSETAMITSKLEMAHVQYLRVHNVAAQITALRLKNYL